MSQLISLCSAAISGQTLSLIGLDRMNANARAHNEPRTCLPLSATSRLRRPSPRPLFIFNNPYSERCLSLCYLGHRADALGLKRVVLPGVGCTATAFSRLTLVCRKVRRRCDTRDRASASLNIDPEPYTSILAGTEASEASCQGTAAMRASSNCDWYK